MMSSLTFAAPMTVEVFMETPLSPDALTIQADQITVTPYFLKDQEKVDELLNQHLPQNEADATRYAQQFIAEHGQDFAKRIASAHLGQELVKRYKLTRFPAYVFNHEIIIYDATHIESALEEYQRWLDAAGY